MGVYTEMLSKARDGGYAADDRRTPERLNADAVVNVRYTTSAISQGMSEILAYGTAVRLR